MNVSLIMLLLLGLFCLAISAEGAPDQVDKAASARSRFKRPTLPGFQHFKSVFQRHYRSLAEELIRQWVFMGKTFRIFISCIWYKRGKQSYYLALNEMSDRTPAELERGQPALSQLKAEQTQLTERPLASLVDSLSDTQSGDLNSPVNLRYANRPVLPEDEDKNEDEVFSDLRASMCLGKPRSQRNCASCYMFPVIAMYEWQFCIDTGKRVSFSEQYLLDCGARSGLSGCRGGRASQAVEFTRRHGLALRRHYPYEGERRQCPYARNVAPARMGPIRADNIELRAIVKSFFAHHLQHRPIIVYLAVQDHFHEYGGGVDDGKGCQPHRNHMVLIVGHGREDGIDYWLMRNSYGVKYGEAGYYKIDKRANCTAFLGHGYVFKGNFAQNNRNEMHLDEALNQHQRQVFESSLRKIKLLNSVH